MVDRLKRIGFLGTTGGVCFSTNGFDSALSMAGENTGNFLFQNAMWQIIRNPKTDITFSEKIGFVKENFDLLVIPAANQVNPQWDLGWWAKFIESADLPIVIVGLGAQAAIDGSHKVSLQSGTQRFLKAVSERTPQIGVRGEFTQEVLKYQGIENTVVTGCPSNFTNRAISGQHIESMISAIRKKRTFSSFYLFGTMEPDNRRYEHILFDFARKNLSQITYQTNKRLLRFLHDRSTDKEALKYLSWERDFFAPKESLDDYSADIAKRGRFYSHAKHWIDEAGRADISFGMRIHGSVAAIQGGSLGVCIAFDSRTLELVETMKYPFIHTDDLAEKETPATLWSKIRFDAETFDSQRDVLWQRYISIMKDAGIRLADEIAGAKKAPTAAE